MLRDGDEHVDLVPAWLAAGDRLVDGEDAEQPSVGAAHRCEERVVRMPRVRVVGHRQVGRECHALVRVPIELAVGDEVRAALQEALVEQRLPVCDLAHLAEQRFACGVAAVHRADDEVVPFAAIEVDHDGAERERVGDGSRDRGEELGKLFAGPHETGHLEEPPQAREDRGLPHVESRHRINRNRLTTGSTSPPIGGATKVGFGSLPARSRADRGSRTPPRRPSRARGVRAGSRPRSRSRRRAARWARRPAAAPA